MSFGRKPEVRKYTDKNGEEKEVLDVLFPNMEGKITDIQLRYSGQNNKFYILTLEREKSVLECFINFAVIFRNLMVQIEGLNLSKEVFIEPKISVKTNSIGKVVTSYFLNIRQDNRQIYPRYTKEKPGQMPPMEFVDGHWNADKQQEWLEKNILSKIQKKLGTFYEASTYEHSTTATTPTPGVNVQNYNKVVPEEIAPPEGVEDLPF
jgi:hypothetical protein